MNEPGKERPLWAPWRIRYIRGSRTDGCFLCLTAAAADDDSLNHVIARGSACFVLLNAYPYNPGHLLIAPYRHVGDLADLTADERAELLDLLVRAQATVRRAMQPEGFNMGCNLGRVAGAAVPDHVHWHLVPRWCGDNNFMPVIGETDCLPEALEDTARILRAAWE